MKIKEAITRNKEGLPKEAFAIVGEPENPETWWLPHHTKAIFRALNGRIDVERTVDWEGVGAAVAAISPRNHSGQRVAAGPEVIIEAARHLAAHCQKGGKPLPDVLAALI